MSKTAFRTLSNAIFVSYICIALRVGTSDISGEMQIMTKRIIIILLAICAGSAGASAQRFSVSANLLECLDFGTLNAEAAYAVGRHFSVSAGAKFNPWRYGSAGSGYLQNCKRTFNAGMRYWPWNINSGWWFSFKGQWEEYSRSLPVDKGRSEDGDALGAGFSIGYALMLNRHFNIDFGLGAWGGGKKYTVYECPRCGRIVSGGTKGFIGLNDVQASLVYVF